MFKIFGSKPNFDKIFSSQQETRNFIYGNRARTSAVLGDEEFISAWLSSKHMGQVTAVIRDEAFKGDTPSLKQMIWLCELCYNDAENNTRDTQRLLDLKSKYMSDRIEFCQKAIDYGLRDQSYYAMTSSAKLYLLRFTHVKSVDDAVTQEALAGIVRYAKLFIESGSGEPELVDDAKRALKQYGPMAALVASMRGG